MFGIRKATVDDCSRIAELHYEAVQSIRTEHYSASELEAWATPRKKEDYLQSVNDKDFLVATEDKLIVAFGVLNREKQEIEALFSSPEVRGTGVGLQVLRQLESLAREQGIHQLSLNASLNAVGFYEKAGFVAQEESTYRLHTGVVIRCVPMTKVLVR